MLATTLLLAASVAGVDTGWQPHDRGGLDYNIQIEPELLAALRAGEALTSEIPAGVEGVRRYRIVVGDKPLPRAGASSAPPEQEPAPPSEQSAAETPPIEASPEKASSAPPPLLTPPASTPRYGAPVEQRPPADELTAGESPAEEEPYPSFEPPPETEPPLNRTAETEPPRILDPAPDAVQTTFKQPAPASPSDRPPPVASSEPQPQGGTALGWTAALLGLTVSLGANIYLAWMWLDTRRHYSALVYQREG
jgi:hypothetical protein